MHRESERLFTRILRKVFDKLGNGFLTLFRHADKALILANIVRMAVGSYCIEPTCKINCPVLQMIINPNLVPLLTAMAILYVAWVTMLTFGLRLVRSFLVMVFFFVQYVTHSVMLTVWEIGADEDAINDEDMEDEADEHNKYNIWLSMAAFYLAIIQLFSRNKLVIILCSFGINQIVTIIRVQEEHLQNQANNNVNNRFWQE